MQNLVPQFFFVRLNESSVCHTRKEELMKLGWIRDFTTRYYEDEATDESGSQ
ncbi:hypothetical protein J5TS2_05010 [Brevibacillus halotolerans]|nr:hypothetical protein J5TS2_05010 [Brevibacillus halotolerans]